MFLTRFRINTARLGSRRLLSSPQVLHAAVMASFAAAPAHTGDDARVLWRVDHNARTDVQLYLVSPTRPDLTHLVEQAGWPTSETWTTYDYTPFLGKLAAGDTWAFRLTANPVHSVRTQDGQATTKRTAHRTPHHQAGWLLQRQESLGFRIVEKPVEPGSLPGASEHELVVHGRRDQNFGKTEQATGHRNRVQLAAVTFDGRLQITDPDTLRAALTRGIGKGKAYGCGLLTLAPTR
jgi:CRISPR system Cascade subunit CasE